MPDPAVEALVDVVSFNDELFFGGAEVTDPAPDCTSTTTSAVGDTDPETVTPPAAKPISGRASYTG